MRKTVIILVITILISECLLCQIIYDCDSEQHITITRFENDTSTKIQNIYIVNRLCDVPQEYVIDFNTFNVPDEFYVLTNSDTIVKSGLVGHKNYADSLSYVRSGYCEYWGDSLVISEATRFPSDFYTGFLTSSGRTGCGRLRFRTGRDTVIIKIVPNQQYSTILSFFVHCENLDLKDEEEYKLVYICHKPIKKFELLDSTKCYRLYADSIEVDPPQPITDTFYYIGITDTILDTFKTVYENDCVQHFINVSIYHNPKVYVPNVFSPNGDGVNDFFQPFSDFTLDNVVLEVFDRWGNKIHSSNNFWDGVGYKPGVYVYKLEYDIHGYKYFSKGNIHLIR